MTRLLAPLVCVLAGIFVAATATAQTTQPTTTAPTTQPTTTPIKYLGKIRTKEWFKIQYKYFFNKIAFNGDSYIDIAEQQLSGVATDVPRDPPKVGCLVQASCDSICSVIQSLKNDQALVQQTPGDGTITGRMKSMSSSVLFHIRGLDPQKNVKGAVIRDQLIYVGIYEYVTTMKAHQSIQSYVICKPLTEKEFADCLSKDFPLVYRRKAPDGKIESYTLK